MAVRIVPHAAGIAGIVAAARAYRDRLTEEIADDTRRYAPVLTGELRASVRTELGGPVSRVWYGDSAAGIDYWVFQEYGTSKMAPQPALRPALYQYRSA